MLTTERHRWSSEGQPTIYLAGDLGVALAEFGRHAAPSEPERARVWSVRVELDAVADLRLAGRAKLSDDPAWFLDRARCCDLACRLRATGRYEAVVVPSVAMLDRPDRWNLVVFADRVKRPLSAAVSPLGSVLTIDPATPSSAR